MRLLKPDITKVPFGFTVSEWDTIEQNAGTMLACSGNACIADAAFEAATILRPNSVFVLCQGARIMRWHPADYPALRS
jgi:hypothetical protein